MPQLMTHRSGAFRYLPGGAAYSTGVVAEPGWRIVDVEFARPLSLEEGLDRVARVLHERTLTPESLVGIELRSPGQVSAEEFGVFNESYLDALRQAGLLAGVEPLPIARTNVVPTRDAPSSGQVQRFQVIEPCGNRDGGDFVISGCADKPSNDVTFDGDDTVFRGKVEFVIRSMHSVLAQLGLRESALNRVDVYTDRQVDWLEPTLAERIGAVAQQGLHRWQAVPPVAGLEFEISGKRISAWERLA